MWYSSLCVSFICVCHIQRKQGRYVKQGKERSIFPYIPSINCDSYRHGVLYIAAVLHTSDGTSVLIYKCHKFLFTFSCLYVGCDNRASISEDWLPLPPFPQFACISLAKSMCQKVCAWRTWWLGQYQSCHRRFPSIVHDFLLVFVSVLTTASVFVKGGLPPDSFHGWLRHVCLDCMWHDKCMERRANGLVHVAHLQLRLTAYSRKGVSFYSTLC